MDHQNHSFLSRNEHYITSVFVCAQLLSHVRLSATLWTVARRAPLSLGIFQARILEWVVISSSRGSSRGLEFAFAAWQADSLLLSLLEALPNKLLFSH